MRGSTQSLINVKTAAALLGVSTGMVYQLADAKKLPHVRIGSRLLFRPEALEAWLQAQEVKVGDGA